MYTALWIGCYFFTLLTIIFTASVMINERINFIPAVICAAVAAICFGFA